MAFQWYGEGQLPGIDSVRETFEAIISWGAWEVNRSYVYPASIDGSVARDLGNTVALTGNTGARTTILRPGLIMSQNASTGLWAHHINADATWGKPPAILLYNTDTQRFGGDVDKWFGYVLVGGQVKGGALIYSKADAEGQPGAWDGIATVGAALKLILDVRYIRDDLFANP